MKVGGTDIALKKIQWSQIQWTTSAVWLVIMNFIPVLGVFLFNWDAGILLWLYWVESLVLGVLNIPKILSCQGSDKAQARSVSFGGRLFLAMFFTVHYGMFCFGHVSFLSSFFETIPTLSTLFEVLFSTTGLLVSVIGLTVSHFISMVKNFYGKGEYLKRSPSTQMFMPYGRIIILHIVVIFGGVLVQSFGSPVLALLLLVVLKTLIDLVSHNVEHANYVSETA